MIKHYLISYFLVLLSIFSPVHANDSHIAQKLAEINGLFSLKLGEGKIEVLYNQEKSILQIILQSPSEKTKSMIDTLLEKHKSKYQVDSSVPGKVIYEQFLSPQELAMLDLDKLKQCQLVSEQNSLKDYSRVPAQMISDQFLINFLIFVFVCFVLPNLALATDNK